MAGGVTVGSMLLVVVVAALAIFLLVKIFREREKAIARRDAIAAMTEIGAVAEEFRITGWGWFSRAALVFSILLSIYAMDDARNVLQQILASVGLISSAIIFGVGMILGRRRTYRVYGKPELFKMVPRMAGDQKSATFDA
ncbi:hypothetical protein QY049_03515 [Bradyrhizobium sp. WYCCWR 13022]|uniref:hypothetical protein n=1 Tax=unclassified Bradyrhizobium TaxID=2631580 RepID=UPI00263A8F85|nr:hypothetical protein [Bradyrhizobium sp. WYCCWR 13022]MDN4982291.1 hypothetical protein [Bradyrhizobium sp. WYCCWR 13022]